jgi:hypothetical protein
MRRTAPGRRVGLAQSPCRVNCMRGTIPALDSDRASFTIAAWIRLPSTR